MSCEQINTRAHRVTGRPPAELLVEEHRRLHVLPSQPVTVAFGQTRLVCWDWPISVAGVRYSVPHPHIDERVWARWAGDELIVTVVDNDGVHEIARHQRGNADAPNSRDEHYPPNHPSRRPVPGERTPRAANSAEAAFLAIGDGAAAWLLEAGATGTSRVRSKMAEAVAFVKLHGQTAVDQALGTAALAGRFADNDLAAILTHQQAGPSSPPVRITERHSLQPGTAGWAHFGAPRPGR